MAWLERRGERYRIAFRFRGEKFRVNLKASDQREADGGRPRGLTPLASGHTSSHGTPPPGRATYDIPSSAPPPCSLQASYRGSGPA